MSQDEFYKNEYFKLIDKRFDDLNDKIDELSKDISTIKNKITWIYAYSAGVAGVVAFIINIIPLIKK